MNCYIKNGSSYARAIFIDGIIENWLYNKRWPPLTFIIEYIEKYLYPLLYN